MDYIRDFTDRISIPSIPIPTLSKERLYSLLALVTIIVVGLADIIFVRSFIVPRLEDRKELASQLISAEESLEEAIEAKEANPGKLQKQVEAAQAKLDDMASAFLSDSQVAETLDRLYQYASESQVDIVNLQTKPPPEEEAKSTYDVKRFGLQVHGDLPDLVDFISRIKEAALEGFVISNVSIPESEEEQYALTMDITLYTSPYSPGAAGQATPSVPPPPATPATASLAQLEEELDAVWTKDWEQAISLIKQIRAIDPDYPDMTEKLYSAHVNYGHQLLGEGDSDGAKVQFENALEINPEGPEALGGLEKADAWVETPAAPTPGTPAPTLPPTPTGPPAPTLTVEEQLEQSLHEAWAVASDDDKGAEEWEEVIGLIRQILAINPNRDDMTEKLYAAHVNYGRQLAAEGELEKAKEEFTRALDIKPDGGEARAELEALAAGETPVPPTTPTPESQYTIHVVKPGENLFRIALEHDTTVEAIKAANGLTNNIIHVGQELRIPVQ